jgi:hypothetical protein
MQGEFHSFMSFMRKRRLFVVAFIVGAVSLGIPSQVSAAPSFPPSLTAVRTVLSQVDPGQSKTLSVSMPWRANMIGVSYVDATHSQDGVAVAARAHTVDGWSAWEDLGGNDNGAMGVEAGHESKRLTTEALWVGTADHVEVKVAVASTAEVVRDVRVHLINTLGDSKPQNFFVRALHAIGRFLSMRAAPSAAPAQAATTQPKIISRAQWGANPAYLNLPCPGIAPDLKMAFVHHSDTTNSYTASQSAGIVRGIYAYHTNTRGYCDIAYNFLIDKYGQIFEGRNGGITNNVIGAHTGGYNYGTVGVALLGNYSTARPTSAMLSSLEKLLAWRLDIAHVPPTGIVSMTTGTGNDHTAAGTVVNFNRIAGHRDASLTSCPGNYVYNDLPGIRTAVAAIGTPKIYLPLVTPLDLRPDGDGQNDSIRATAAFSTTVTWTFRFIAPNGTVVRTVTGTASAMKFYWGAQTANGAYVPDGIYRWTLDAVDAAGHSATGASGTISVVTSHPDGTLLQDSTGKYLIDGGQARPVDALSYASTFGSLPAIATGPAERARYTTGAAASLREGTLLVDPNGEHYIWSGGALRHFTGTTFTDLKYVASAALAASATTIAALPAGPAVTSSTVHPDGTAVSSGGALYVVDSGALRPMSSLARASWYRTNEVVPAAAGDPVVTGTLFPVRDGTYIKATDGGTPWVVSDGTKHRLVSNAFATLMGYTSQMMLTASQTDINAIPTGSVIATAASASPPVMPSAGDAIRLADVAGTGRASLLWFGSDAIHVLRSSGSAFGSDEKWTTVPFIGTRSNEVADVTGDGKSDVIAVDDSGISVRRSSGTAFGSVETWAANPYFGSHGTYFADVTGDGKADAIVVNSSGITVRPSDGTKFLPNQAWSTKPYYGSLGTYFADVTGDGKADAIVVNSSGITVRPSNGSKFLANQAWTSGFYGSRATYFADVTGDGKADAIALDSSGIRVRPSTGSSFGSATAWSTNPYYGSLGTFFSDVTGDHEADGIVVSSSAITTRRSDGTQFLANERWYSLS